MLLQNLSVEQGLPACVSPGNQGRMICRAIGPPISQKTETLRMRRQPFLQDGKTKGRVLSGGPEQLCFMAECGFLSNCFT